MDATQRKSWRKTVSLAFGGGGARGSSSSTVRRFGAFQGENILHTLIGVSIGTGHWHGVVEGNSGSDGRRGVLHGATYGPWAHGQLPLCVEDVSPRDCAPL